MFQGTLSNALESLIRQILRSSCSQIIKYKYEEYAHSPTELTCDSSLHVLFPEEDLMCEPTRNNLGILPCYSLCKMATFATFHKRRLYYYQVFFSAVFCTELLCSFRAVYPVFGWLKFSLKLSILLNYKRDEM